jgi:malonyl-CoA O-methyltransferase
MDGFVMFSTVGPDTLRSLREAYREAGWGSPHAPFVDMHDLGDMLVRAGFADPVMDQEMLRLTWATPAALLAELRSLGINADPARAAGLRTPRWRARLEAALAERAQQQKGPDGRITLEFEIVYGHAFNPPPRVAVAGETRLSAADLQRMARTGRNGAPLR